jgi:hypothetical protein
MQECNQAKSEEYTRGEEPSVNGPSGMEDGTRAGVKLEESIVRKGGISWWAENGSVAAQSKSQDQQAILFYHHRRPKPCQDSRLKPDERAVQIAS